MNAVKPYLSMSLIDICNFRCVYCPPAGENYHTPRAVFDLDKAKALLDMAAELGMGKVRFTGGEPTLYPHLRAIVEYGADLGLEVHVNTNGLLLHQHFDWMKDVPRLVVKISLDAVTREALSRVNGVTRLDTVLANLRRGAELGLVKRINFVLTRLNVDQVPGVLALCKELGLSLKIFDMYPVPETEDRWRQLYAAPDALHLEGTAAPAYAYSQKFGTPTRELLIDGVPVRIKNCFDGTHYHATCRNCPNFPCPEGLYCLLVTPSLTVAPCRLGAHLQRACRVLHEVKAALQAALTLYEESYFANWFGRQHRAFYRQHLQTEPLTCALPLTPIKPTPDRARAPIGC